MRAWQVGLLCGIMLAWTTPVQAQFLFGRKQARSVNAPSRVPELILIVKTDPDERKRLHAVEELREYDVKNYTEITPVLLDVLQNDKKMNVRLEALNGLSRTRPIPPFIQQALERAANADESRRVRWQAKAILTKWQLTGSLPNSKQPVTSTKQTNEPPTQGPLLSPTTVSSNPPPVDAPPRPLPFNPATSRPLTPGANPAPTAPAPTNPPVQGPVLFP
jgi:hypothetical protein